jgi:hypothetical protein
VIVRLARRADDAGIANAELRPLCERSFVDSPHDAEHRQQEERERYNSLKKSLSARPGFHGEPLLRYLNRNEKKGA